MIFDVITEARAAIAVEPAAHLLEIAASCVAAVCGALCAASLLRAGATPDVRTDPAAAAKLEDLRRLRRADDYHEDHGVVLWWHVPICEPPYCGTPLDDDFDPLWFTHWSPVPDVLEPRREPNE